MGTHTGKIIFPFLIAAAVASGYVVYRTHPTALPSADFSQRLTVCNATPVELRFSCYRALIQRRYERDGKPALTQFIRNIRSIKSLSFHSDDSSYAIFGTNCHTFYHALGDFVATYVDPKISPTEGRNLLPRDCTDGATMGFYKRLALRNGFPTGLLQAFYAACQPAERYRCSHEIGHILYDKYLGSILEILDTVSNDRYGLTPSEPYRYVTFDRPDLNAPFEDCKRITAEAELAYCLTGMGHNLSLFSEFMPNGGEEKLDRCSRIDTANRDACYSFFTLRFVGLGAAPQFVVGNYGAGNAACEKSAARINRPDLVHHCYRGIGSGIGLFVESEYPDGAAPGPGERRERFRSAVAGYGAACRKVRAGFMEECIKGLLETGFKDTYRYLGIRDDAIDNVLSQIREAEGKDQTAGGQRRSP